MKFLLDLMYGLLLFFLMSMFALVPLFYLFYGIYKYHKLETWWEGKYNDVERWWFGNWLVAGARERVLSIVVFGIVLTLSFISSTSSPEQVYSFKQESPFIYQHKTSSYNDVISGIPYYTHNINFAKEYLPNSVKLKSLEKNIERDFSDYTYYTCLREKEQRQYNINRANGDWTWRYSLAQAKATPIPTCDTYLQYFGRKSKI